jgi:outer membrane protein TolC
MKLKSHFLATGLFLLILQGCSLAPEYQRPELPVAATLSAGDAGLSDPVEELSLIHI